MSVLEFKIGNYINSVQCPMMQSYVQLFLVRNHKKKRQVNLRDAKCRTNFTNHNRHNSNLLQIPEFCFSIFRSLYLVILLAVALTILQYCGTVTSINCTVCYESLQITRPGLLNFTILSVRSGAYQYIVTSPFVVVERDTWCNHN